MSSVLVDVVNFNADASCLSSSAWLNALGGGTDSVLYRWLNIYVQYKKKVVIGFPGATLADIVMLNPDSVDLINSNQDIFEIIIRPFAHDISLLRTKEGFRTNLEYGVRVIKKEFVNVANYYLPPEFMCNATHTQILSEFGLKGVFINRDRFDEHVTRKLPKTPFTISGTFESSMCCIPVDASTTSAYLDSIHNYSAEIWNKCFDLKSEEVRFSWRDGESAFLIPDTINREANWLSKENHLIDRKFLSEIDMCTIRKNTSNCDHHLEYYPIHSFSAWIKEMKMYWYVDQVQAVEKELSILTEFQKYLWLYAINSDLLSAVEKKPPKIQLKNFIHDDCLHDFILDRREKSYEGEECLQMIYDSEDIVTKQYFEKSNRPHMKKLRNRVNYLKQLVF